MSRDPEVEARQGKAGKEGAGTQGHLGKGEID